MIGHSPATPRRIATAAKTTVVVGAGVAFGLMTAHLQAMDEVTLVQSEASTAATTPATAVPAKLVRPEIVTIVKKKHVPSDPIIIYREVPVATGGGTSTGNTGSTGSGSGYSGGGSSSGGGGGYSGGSTSSGGGSGSSSSGGSAPISKPAPQPAPVQAPAPATSKSS